MAEVRAQLFEMQKKTPLFIAAFCEELLRQTPNLMSCEYYEFSKEARASCNNVVRFHSGDLLGPFMIRALSLHLRSSACVYQDLISSGPFNLIFLVLR